MTSSFLAPKIARATRAMTMTTPRPPAAAINIVEFRPAMASSQIFIFVILRINRNPSVQLMTP